jgi:SAM-dependent methyltransferase
MRLATKKNWKKEWSSQKIETLDFDPLNLHFREQHRLFEKYVQKSDSKSVIEIGCYPGRYLHYFHKYFGYIPWGVEYVESCASHATKLLENSGVPATILHEDFFNLDLHESPDKDGWDVTISFGFVEHFDDSTEAIAKHIEITKPGGLIFISIPNHVGINGWILRKVDKPLWDLHNKMSLKDLEAAVQRAGGAEILHASYIGHMGFAASKLWPAVRTRFGSAFPLFRTPGWLMERMAQWILPNNRWISPKAVVVLRKKMPYSVDDEA